MQIDNAQTALMAAAVASQQALLQTAMQMALLRNAAESEQAVVEMIRAEGLGENVDVMA